MTGSHCFCQLQQSLFCCFFLQEGQSSQLILGHTSLAEQGKAYSSPLSTLVSSQAKQATHNGHDEQHDKEMVIL